MREIQIVEAFQASIKNHEKCSSGEDKIRGVSYKIKYVAWYLLLTFFSPHKEPSSDVFTACMTPVNERRIREFSSSNEIYKFAKLNASIRNIKENISVLSEYSLPRRIRIFCKGVGLYHRHRKELLGYFHFVLEYNAIALFLEKHHFREYITPGMYDRYCTLFSYLGRLYGAKLVGVQDGAAVSIDVPAKVYCDEMNCFDEFEGNILRKFIKNEDCRYIYTGFKSVISWSEYPKGKKKILAIASQDWFTSKTLDLIDAIMQSEIPDSWDVIVLPHYRESEESYKVIRNKYPGLIVEPKKRYQNIDLLITFYSTIVYDFWSVNKDLCVYCLKIPGYIPGYYQRYNVHVFETFEELVDGIRIIRMEEKV